MKYKVAVIPFIHSLAEKLMPAYNNTQMSIEHAWWTIEAITKKTKSWLLLQDTITMSPEEYTQIRDWADKQVTQYLPLQYLIGSVPFNNVEILVEPPTLIPRPETEEWCLDLITKLQTLNNKTLTILDLCTGSGCIAIALAKALPSALIYATDISDKAIELTKKNCEHNNITNVTIVKSDLFKQIPKKVRFDLIVGNPPYLGADEWEELDEFVTNWEDPRALVAARNGVGILETIIKQASQFITQNDEMKHQEIPQLILEIGYKQGSTLKKIMQAAGFSKISITKDLAGKDRTVSGRIPHVALISSSS